MTANTSPIIPPPTVDNIEAYLQQEGLLERAEADIRKYIERRLDAGLRARVRKELGYGPSRRLHHHVTRDLRALKLFAWYKNRGKPRVHVRGDYYVAAHRYMDEYVKMEKQMS